jgi:uncharacterized protein YecT (DUF1311 family)
MKAFIHILIALFGASQLAAQTQAEINREANSMAAKADAEMNAVYKELMPKLDRQGLDLLKLSQRAWLAYRDAEAAMAADTVRGGSLASAMSAGTVAELTRARTALLRERMADITGSTAPIKKPPVQVVAPPVTPPSGLPEGSIDPMKTAQQFFDAYRKHNSKAARLVATQRAMDRLAWTKSSGENESLQLVDDHHIYYEGGSIQLKQLQNKAGRWYITDVVLFAD